jgi:cyclase
MRRSFLLALLIALPALAQQDFSKVEVKAQKVAGSVYMITGAGGNIGVSAGDDGIVIVDDQFAPLAPKIREALRGITGKPIKFILNTHFHGDHTGGNEDFGKDAPIIAQTNVRKRLQSGSKNPNREIPPAPKGALPVVTFDDKVSVWANGEEIRAVHMPHGHTDGDSIIYFTASNVVHMGDDFFNGNFPFIDVDSGGSVRGYIANVEKVLATIPDDAKVIPGHGALSDKAGLRSFLAMLKGTWSAVEAGRKAGKTAEQLKADHVLAQWEEFGKGFIKTERWIDTLYGEMGKP